MKDPPGPPKFATTHWSLVVAAKLILVNKATKLADLDLRFRNICPSMMKVFRLTRLNKLFKIGEGNYGEEDGAEFAVPPFPSRTPAETVSRLKPTPATETGRAIRLLVT